MFEPGGEIQPLDPLWQQTEEVFSEFTGAKGKAVRIAADYMYEDALARSIWDTVNELRGHDQQRNRIALMEQDARRLGEISASDKSTAEYYFKIADRCEKIDRIKARIGRLLSPGWLAPKLSYDPSAHTFISPVEDSGLAGGQGPHIVP